MLSSRQVRLSRCNTCTLTAGKCQKRASMRDILAGHRVPPQNLGVIPETAGGFGDANVADQLAYDNEIVPLQQQMKEINDWLGQEVISFRPYKEDEK